MQILDLIAKVSWDTNTKALEGINNELRKEDKLLEELREKGRRLNQQMINTNDPKKVKSLNDELQKTKKSVDSIIESQKKQATTTEALIKKQKDFISQLKNTNDPKLVQGLLRNLQAVDNQLSALSNKATSLPSKFGSIGKSLLQGFGLGAGVFTLTSALQGIEVFVGSSIAEFEDAQKTAMDLQRTLKAIGQGQYFDGLIQEAGTLATRFHNLFDNDEIIKAQTALAQYGKVSRQEMSQLLPIIMNLATAQGIDLVSATEKIVNIIEGRGGQTLRDYGISIKGVKTEHDRLNLVLGDFSKKLTGVNDDYAKTAQGIAQQNKVLLGNVEEQFGESFSKLKNKFLPFITSLLTGINSALEGTLDLAYVGEMGAEEKALREKVAQRRAFLALQGAGGAKGAFGGNKALNPNADFTEEEVKKEVKKVVKSAKQIALEEDQKILLQARLRLGKLKPGEVTEADIDREVKDFLKVVNDAVQRNQAQLESSFDSDEKRENMLGISTESDIKANNTRNEIITEQDKKAQDERTKQAKEASDEREKIEREALFNNALIFANEISSLLSVEEQRTQKAIDLQEKRVESAKNGSERSLAIEQNRLDELTRKREKFERAQRIIDAGVIVANQAVAISGAVRTIASGGNPILIAANVLAILAGITASVTAIRSINAGFKEGGYTGDGDPSDVSTALGNRGYKYHKKEFVMKESITSKHRDMLEGMHNGSLIVNKLNDGYYLTNRTIDTDKAISDHYTVKTSTNMQGVESVLNSINEKLSQREMKLVNNFDADGFGQVIASQLGRVHINSKMRG